MSRKRRRLPRFLSPPERVEPDKAVRTRVQYEAIVALGVINSIASVFFIVVMPEYWLRWAAIGLSFVVFSLVTIQLIRKGWLTAAGWLMTGSIWAMLTAAAWTAGGVNAPSITAQVVAAIMAGMLLGWRSGLYVGAGCTIVVLAMAAAQQAGWVPPPVVEHTPFTYAFVIVNYIVMIAVLQAITMRALGSAHDEALEEAAERRRVERQVRDLNEELDGRVKQRTAQLEEALASLESFSYSVSHDLRAPLRAVNGFSGILQEDYAEVLDEDGRRLCGRIRENTMQMGTLIDDLLRFSRLRSAGIETGVIDMQAMALAVFAEVEPDAEASGISLVADGLPAVRADSAMIRQVWANLLANAVKFSRGEPHPCIEVTGVARDGMVVYTVRDNGVGFDAQYEDRLFLVFERLHGKEYEGSGIGLAIAKRIVEAHGGSIWAKALPEGGAAFSFSLPSEPAASP